MKVLILYDLYSPHSLRQTFADHLYSFRKFSDHRIFYCNYAFGIPVYLSWIRFDLVIFHQFFSAQFRWCGLSYEKYLSRLDQIKKIKAPKVVFVQDEFFKTESLCRFINEFKISQVFSVAGESEWSKIYAHVDHKKVKFCKVLTGYLDDDIENTLKILQDQSKGERSIDIGYRAWQVPAWLGRQGKLKIDISHTVGKKAQAMGWNVDISMVSDEKNFFHGLDWYRFLLRCRCFIGVEGGSSLLDDKGEIYQKIKEYLMRRPSSTFEEIESACFSGLDGNLNLTALSPRHLEACATKTCQILVRGSYNHLLEPGIHYLALNRDFSNLEEVLSLASQEEIRNQITERAYRDIVTSGKYKYSVFVKGFFAKFQPINGANNPIFLYWINRIREWLLWKRMPFEFFLFKKVKKYLPQNCIERLRSWRNRSAGVS